MKSIDSPSLFLASHYCWAEDVPPSRNLFVSFEQDFSLPEVLPASLWIHLFADTRFRVWINGEFLAYGPARFVTAHPEYDSYDLAPHIQGGLNHIRVEVNYYGCSSFQSMPDGKPGFIAAGGLGTVDFRTPGNWKARMHRAWAPHAPLFSFAQNPAEICDTRILAMELAGAPTVAVVPLPASQCPWPKPEPRTAPYPDYKLVTPVQISVAAPVVVRRRWGFQLHLPGLSASGARPEKRFANFVTWIHSPRAQNIELDCFWSELELNGIPVEIVVAKRLGNHATAQLSLQAGWSLLAGTCECLLEHWSYIIGAADESGLTLHATRSLECRDAFLRSDLRAFVAPPSLLELVARPHPPGWHSIGGAISHLTPARVVAWEQPDPSLAVRDLPYGHLPESDCFQAEVAVWCFDFKDEFYGQPVIEVEAPEGSVLDVAYDDWRRTDGCVNLYGSTPFTDAVDRFVLRGGRQRIEVLNPRGGFYIQITLRAPEDGKSCELRMISVGIRRRTTLNHCEGTFVSGDSVLDWTWACSTRTLKRSTDEAYSDCPWRERGSYIGDSLVNISLHRLISADASVARRTLRLFAWAQMPDGQLQACAPSWLTKPHEDFTLLWIIGVHDYWARSGDAEFLKEQIPVIERIFASDSWTVDTDGLWGTTGKRLFIDWGVPLAEREGDANSVINILRIAALRAFAEMLDALEEVDSARTARKEAAHVQTLLLARNWHSQQCRFRPYANGESEAAHANILALRFGIGPADSLLRYLEPILRRNFEKGINSDQNAGFVELYYFHYLLPALVKHGKIGLAESLIRQTYGFLKQLSRPTLCECFHRASEGRGSSCHSWSGAPAVYATEHVLGLRLAHPGNPDVFLLDPVDTGRNRVSGSIPHPRGRVSVEWRRSKDNRFLATVLAPWGVSVQAGPSVDMETPALS